MKSKAEFRQSVQTTITRMSPITFSCLAFVGTLLALGAAAALGDVTVTLFFTLLLIGPAIITYLAVAQKINNKTSSAKEVTPASSLIYESETLKLKVEVLSIENETLNKKLVERYYTAGTLERDGWLSKLNQAKYTTELEVEIKFITVLLLYLGWNLQHTSIRVNLSVNAGRQDHDVIADWLLWGDTNGHRIPFMIIEAKSPREDLDSAVLNQARSYAFASKAPYYMVTNSQRIAIYQLAIHGDQILFDQNTNDLGIQWGALQSVFDQAARMAIPQRV